jgi:hypothetical protein
LWLLFYLTSVIWATRPGDPTPCFLKPEEIGVQLTEGFMMDPEASVSALVFHHPDCTYFGAGETGLD